MAIQEIALGALQRDVILFISHLFPFLQQQQNTASSGQQDALDKGISSILDKTGHHQQGSTVEKISDGFRKYFKKVTGKGE
jgi:hypothetical protein